MRRITFYNNNKSDNLLHIETEGAVINIRVNLHDTEGREVNHVEILPDNTTTDGNWYIVGENGERVKCLSVPIKNFGEVND